MLRCATPTLCAAGMDNHIKIWSLEQHRHILQASDEWQAERGHGFPPGHVTMPVFSTEVSLRRCLG